MGDELLKEFLRSVERASENPHLHPIVETNVRRVLLDRFPYGVFYRVEQATIVVIAFLHGKRDPMHWRRRS